MTNQLNVLKSEGMDEINLSHNQVSGQLINLLFLNTQKILKKIEQSYSDIGGDKCFLLTPEEKEKIKAFFNQEIKDEDIDVDTYQVFQEELEEIEFLIEYGSDNNTMHKVEYNPSENMPKKMKALKGKTTGISFSNPYDSPIDIEELYSIIEASPRSLRAFDFEKGMLLSYSIEEIVEIMHKLPERLLILGLIGNLRYFSLGELVKLMDSLPRSVKRLAFHENNFASYGMDYLKVLLKNLPEGIKDLYFMDCKLGFFNPDDIMIFLSNLPKGLERLDLSYNRFEYGVKDFKSMIKAIPRTLKDLKIGGNRLYWFEYRDLLNIIVVLPSKLESLSLWNNGLGNYQAKHLVKIFERLPYSLNDLDLSNNELELYSKEDLKLVMQNLPKNLKKVNLRSNGLDSMTKEDLGIREDIEVVL